MKTKRELIMAELHKNGLTVLDDLVPVFGWERRNLQDNLKACVNDGLIERKNDDVTGLPAYQLSALGKKWIAKNSSVTTQAGSGDITPAVAGDATSLASVSPGQAATVIEPPTPDDAPVAVRSDESALSKTVTEFCEWLGKKAKVRKPLNLRECKAVVKDMVNGLEMIGDLETENRQLRGWVAQWQSVGSRYGISTPLDMDHAISSRNVRIGQIKMTPVFVPMETA